MPKVSIVVPFYNVEEFLEECLESLAAQTLRDLEIVMVDDGSPDNSAVIAKAFADRDPRFVLVQQENQGLGGARNTGARHATGEYLAFVDSDDIVPVNAYELLAGLLDETGSDLATGNVWRLMPIGLKQCTAQASPLREIRKRTTIHEHPELMRDRIACNKLFRRSFWTEHGFAFPGGLYEDSPVVIRAFALATSIDVHSEHVYYWRRRDDSITGRSAELDNLRQRLATSVQVREDLPEDLRPAWDDFVLEADFGSLTKSLPLVDPGDVDQVVALAKEYLALVGPEVIARQNAWRRLRLYLLQNGMLPELLKVLSVPLVEREGLHAVRSSTGDRWFAPYPYFGGSLVPASVYDVTDEITLLGRIDTATWQDGRLRLRGHARFDQVGLPAPDAGKISIVLREAQTGRRIEVPAVRDYRPDVTLATNQAEVCQDWSGFVVDVDPKILAKRGRLKHGDWHLEATVRVSGLSRTVVLDGPELWRFKWTEGRQVNAKTRLQPLVDGNRFQLAVRRPAFQVEDCRFDGTGLHLTITGDGDKLVVRRSGGKAVTVPVSGGKASVPVEKFRTNAPVRQGGKQTYIRETVDWTVSLVADGRRRKLAADLPEARHTIGDHEFMVTSTKFGNVKVVERSPRLVVQDLSWSAEGELEISGSCSAPAYRPETLLLRKRGTGETLTSAVLWNAVGFTARVHVACLERPGFTAPVGQGSWDVLTAAGASAVPLAVERATIRRLPDWTQVESHQYLANVYGGDSLQVRARPALTYQEAGMWSQRRLREEFYPSLRERPVRDLVVFDSYNARQFSDNPRAVFEELVRRGTAHEMVWISRDGQFTAPAPARIVLQDSTEHYRALAEARYIVANNPLPEWFVKREGQTYVQTWHGTPLKRIGFDIERPVFKDAARYLEMFSKDVAQWDHLLSPNPFSTPVLRQAFRYEGNVLETGYPRNDLLLQDGAAIRARLSIPADKRVVLYAPTWRDGQSRADSYTFDMRLNAEDWRSVLGKDHVLLVRGHCLVGDSIPGADGTTVIDVSRYPDVADLCAAADVLITDYSSVMFDFAVTGKPILLYTFDLEHYRDDLRGFYFDLATRAPGPLLRTQEDVFAALRDLDSVVEEHQEAYTAFTAEFCPWDDGSAAARVIDEIFRT